MQTKFIQVQLPEGHKLAMYAYSIDGRTWSTCKRSLVAFHRRALDERRSCRGAFERIDTGELRNWDYVSDSW